ncbi:ABC transporter ATP-binding protein [Sporosarcina sp. FSL W8-0480]|uniref:ABC transporter ATP-binding protein n=1 Tax=Sporosarcina sp. FSL W8-0480 TaxID=2954701 RepID=UPI0030DC599C
MQNIHKSFGGIEVIKGASIDIKEFEICGLIGPNGAGKSTFFNMISGLIRPDSGSIIFNGQDITREKPFKIANLGIGRTFQIVRPYKGLTVRENLLPALMYAGKESNLSKATDDAEKLLELVNLSHKANIPAEYLTLSEKKSLEIAKALATRPKLLLLDECFAGLSTVDVDEKIRQIKHISKELKLTILIVEHVMKAVMEVCDRVFVLSAGGIIANGVPEEVVKDENVINVYLGQRKEVKDVKC